ncbi:MAG: AIR synthase-related protein, partial [ANME-2 cluster archaeon]|nr:AIR synthase-related protein [ANME-2 cluster archaeon]
TFRQSGDAVILVGDTKDELGASEYYAMLGEKDMGIPPSVPEELERTVNTLIHVIESGLVTSAHDISHGGMAISLCEMVGPVGAEVDVSGLLSQADDTLFSESQARMLITTPEPQKVLDMLSGILCKQIGSTGGKDLIIRVNDKEIQLTSLEIKEAGQSISHMMMD